MAHGSAGPGLVHRIRARGARRRRGIHHRLAVLVVLGGRGRASKRSPARRPSHAWLPMFEVWQIGLGLMAVLTAVNLASARSYGEFEFWFASIKVAAIVVFIVVAASLVAGRRQSGEPGLREPHRASGLRAVRLGRDPRRHHHRDLLDGRRGDRDRGRRGIGGVEPHDVAARRHRRAAHPAVLRALDRADPVHRAVDAVQVGRFLVRAGARAHRHSGRRARS